MRLASRPVTSAPIWGTAFSIFMRCLLGAASLARPRCCRSAAIRRDDVDGARGYCAACGGGGSLEGFVGKLGAEDVLVGPVEIAILVIHGNDPFLVRSPF